MTFTHNQRTHYNLSGEAAELGIHNTYDDTFATSQLPSIMDIYQEKTNQA